MGDGFDEVFENWCSYSVGAIDGESREERSSFLRRGGDGVSTGLLSGGEKADSRRGRCKLQQAWSSTLAKSGHHKSRVCPSC